MAISVSFPFSWAAWPGAGGPISLCAGFLYCILSPTRLILKLSIRGLRAPSAGCWLSLPHPVSNWSGLQTDWISCALSSTPTQSLPINGQRNMHFNCLWNGMFDRHRAEITVMQFTSHPLPVHQFVTVPWDFNPVLYSQPSSPTPMDYATSAVFEMACLAGSEVNIQHYLIW